MVSLEVVLGLLKRFVVVVVLLLAAASPVTAATISGVHDDDVAADTTSTTTTFASEGTTSLLGQQLRQRPNDDDWLYIEERTFRSRIDHYNFRVPIGSSDGSFSLRYYVYDGTGTKRRSRHQSDDDRQQLITLQQRRVVDEMLNATAAQGGEEDVDSSPSVIFFYAGNEANILQFVNNSGYLFDLADYFRGYAVFAEHRYYGLSFPFGKQSLNGPYNISFLTVEQAMADYNLLTVHLRKHLNMSKADLPFVVMGGSYGANLALWLRLKYPNIWAGAISSSPTPLKHLLRETTAFAQIETEVYANVSSQCPDIVRNGWKELYESAETEHGRRDLADALGLCSVPLRDDSIADDIYYWIGDALETMVQYGYPYPHSYYQPVPGYAFQVACRRMVGIVNNTSSSIQQDNDDSNDDDFVDDALVHVRALKAAVDVFYNYTGQAGGCYDWLFDDDGDNDVATIAAAGRRGLSRFSRLNRRKGLQRSNQRLSRIGKKLKQQLIGHGPLGKSRSSTRRDVASATTADDIHVFEDEEDATSTAWGYQTCTEVYQPMPTNGVTDFLLPYQPNVAEYFAQCREKYGVEPVPNWEEITFGGDDVGTGSNIFITNGQLDPWRAAGIQEQPRTGSCRCRSSSSSSIVVRNMDGAAHHLDLRSPHPLDPLSVVAVRSEQKVEIKKWIDEWKYIHDS